MINAKEELLKLTKDTRIIAASIEYGTEYFKPRFKTELKRYYKKVEYEQFLNSLDFEYDNGFGIQYIYGIVWLENNQWLERVEYDGSEYWKCTTVPKIPEYLL